MDTLDTPGEIVEAPPASDTQDAPITTEQPPRAAEVVPEIARIPFADHERVVDGFHRRLDEVSWAKGYKREDVEEALALRRQFQERANRSDEPTPDTKDERGDPYYSPQQAAKWAAWKADAIVSEKMRAIEARIGPIESTFAETRQTNELMGQIDHAIEWPGFADHIDDIRTAIASATNQRRTLSLEQAYIQVVAPMLSGTNSTREAAMKKKWLAELNDTNAVVKDELNPARQASGSRKKESDMTDAELWEHVSTKAKSA